jgi:SNF2 family DNA or RNA helicase
VFDMLQPAIRYEKAQCLDLPEVTFVNRIAPLTPSQKKYYKELKNQMLLEMAGEEVSTVNAAAKMNKLLQISCGAVYSDSGATIEFDVSDRLRVVQEVIDESSHKVLVFVPFRHTIELLKDYLNKNGTTCDVIHGEVPVQKRTSIFKDFQEKQNIKVLIIQPQAASHGVTLTAADTVVWWGPTPSLETYAQANARVHRAGQRHPVTIVRLQGSNAERHLYKMLDTRITDHTKLVDLYKNLLD